MSDTETLPTREYKTNCQKNKFLKSLVFYIITYMYVMEITESTLEQVISSLNDVNLINWTLLYNDKIIRIERIEKNNQSDPM